MAVTTLPTSPSLEFYRKQARALLNSCKSGESESLERVRVLLPSLDPEGFKLNDAHWIIAREHGFPSWSKFKLHIESVAKSNGAQPPTVTKPTAPTAKKGNTIGSDAVKAKTGKGWDEWFAILDAAGCANMSHKEIVAIVGENGVGPWWRQMVTVEYERAKGNRVMFQGCDGDFRSNAGKTLNVRVQAVFDAWNDESKRVLWLGQERLTIRKATSPKSLRITWGDGTNVDVNMFPKGDAKSTIGVECAKLSGPEHVDERKQFWSAALDRLKKYLEG